MLVTQTVLVPRAVTSSRVDRSPHPGPQQRRTGGQLWAKGTRGRGGWGQALMQSWWCGQSPRGSGARPRGVAGTACGFQGPFWPQCRNQEREKVLGLVSQERVRGVSGRMCAGSGSWGWKGCWAWRGSQGVAIVPCRPGAAQLLTPLHRPHLPPVVPSRAFREPHFRRPGSWASPEEGARGRAPPSLTARPCPLPAAGHQGLPDPRQGGSFPF